MSFRKLAPLTLAVAVAASLSACSKTEAAAGDKPAFDLSQVKTPLISLDVADLDPSANACTDLNAFVNGKWLAANPVPGDQVTWGSFEILRERSLEVQHKLVEQVAASKAKAGSIEAKIGDIWNTGSDEAAIEAPASRRCSLRWSRLPRSTMPPRSATTCATAMPRARASCSRCSPMATTRIRAPSSPMSARVAWACPRRATTSTSRTPASARPTSPTSSACLPCRAWTPDRPGSRRRR
jgi:Predicted metalloendopeptidase